MERRTEAPAGLLATADWRPMAFGDRPPSLVPNPLYEPLWPGRRALVELTPAGAVIRELELAGLAGSAGLVAALAAARRADVLLVDGYVAPAPLDRPGGRAAEAASHPAAGITARQMFRQFLIGGLGQSTNREMAVRPKVVLEPLPADAPLGFVAVDLLWLDGQSLLDVPLGERKRLLETVVAEAELVRVLPSVRPPVERWHGQWRSLGFREVAVKGLNSRYQPGAISDDWTLAAIPSG